MEFCTGCGARRDEGARFCLQCGEAFPVQGGAAPSQLFRRKLTWAGPLALLFLFLPWITVSCQGGGPAFSLSGWQLATGTTLGGQKVPGEPILLLVPLAAVAFIVFFLLAQGPDGKTREVLPIAQIVAAGVPLLILFYKYFQWTGEVRRQGAGLVVLHFNLGYLLTVLAFLVAGVGALFELAERQPALTLTPPLGASPSAEPPPASRSLSEASTFQFCPQCGAKTGPGDRFCMECGFQLT